MLILLKEGKEGLAWWGENVYVQITSYIVNTMAGRLRIQTYHRPLFVDGTSLFSEDDFVCVNLLVQGCPTYGP